MSSSQLEMRPAGVTCEKYVAGADGRRCRHYLDNGACTLPGELMCVEWVKRNPPRPGAPTTASATAGEATTATASRHDAQRPIGLSLADIARLRQLRSEVCIREKTRGEFWIVPDYTGTNRVEITPEHLATIERILSVFPDSEVVAVNQLRTPTSADPTS